MPLVNTDSMFDSMDRLNVPRIVRGMNSPMRIKKPNEDHGLGYQNTLVSNDHYFYHIK